MAFNYSGDPTDSNLDWVRWRIGDTIENDGPRPRGSTASNSNYSDDEVNAAVTEEGTKGKAAALLVEILATEWSMYAGSTRTADYQEANRQAEHYRKLGIDLRKKYGGTFVGLAQVAPTRVDGFSDDIDAEET